jgi:hypothetical protein
VEHANNDNAIGTGFIKDQVIVKTIDSPLSHFGQVRMFEIQRRAHFRLPRQSAKGCFGIPQKSLRQIQAATLSQEDEVLYQIAARGLALTS